MSLYTLVLSQIQPEFLICFMIFVLILVLSIYILIKTTKKGSILNQIGRGLIFSSFMILALFLGLIIHGSIENKQSIKHLGKLIDENKKFFEDYSSRHSGAMAAAQLEIQDGWTWKDEGDYSYIRGRVKNIGENVIGYFEVAATYKDENGNVLDTDYTNSGETLRPGWSKEFEISHYSCDEYKRVGIRVQDVRFIKISDGH